MADERHKRGQGRPPTVCVKECDQDSEQRWQYAFGEIKDEDDEGGNTTKCSQHIGGTNFMAAIVSNIKIFASEEFPYPVTSGD